MSEIFDERRRALEEEYFKRRDKESLDRLRAALAEARAQDEHSATMQCPRCNGTLKEEVYDEVRIDRCDTCTGVWLDAGELEQIIGQENASGRWLHVLWPGRTEG